WHSLKLDLRHLCKIRSCAFVLIQHKHNPKVYACSLECILIGYSLDSKRTPATPYSACSQNFQNFLPRCTSDMLGSRQVLKHTIYSNLSVNFAVQVKHVILPMLGHNLASF
ncbi:hypothetical protein BS17DRAFT_864906, partial [Gyrodon lividus]